MKLISKETKTVKSAFSDEFENYLKKQQVKTTYYQIYKMLQQPYHLREQKNLLP